MPTLNAQTGNYIVIAGLIVSILNHYGVNVVQSDVEGAIGLLVTLYGAIHTFVAHKQNPPVTA